MAAYDTHRLFSEYTKTLILFYRAHEALWSQDDSWDGFLWSNADDAIFEVFSYFRIGAGGEILLCVFNMSPVARKDYMIGTPYAGTYRLVLNSDDAQFCGSAVPTAQIIQSEAKRQGSFAHLLLTDLPPQSALIYQYIPNDTEQE